MDIVQELDSHPPREKQPLIWHFRHNPTHIACLRGQWHYICKNPPPIAMFRSANRIASGSVEEEDGYSSSVGE